ncbi:MAG: four helix bundle protein [Candidatus Brocadiia bacterium]|jgi:four helix bundle protein|nr:four helix bundle protein [Candidatus Brocadiia bacterium]
MKDFRQLDVWRKAYCLAVDVYEATSSFPREELCGLTSQMRRASASVPTNVAEGCGTSTDMEFARYPGIARSSASELEYLLPLAHDVGLLEGAVFEGLTGDTVEIKRMLSALLKRLRADH